MKKITISALVVAMIMTIMPINMVSLSAATEQDIKNVRITEGMNYTRIFWQTNKRSSINLSYGDSKLKYNTLVTDDYDNYEHSVILKALDAGTTYYFRIVTDSGIDYKDEFKTLGEKENLTVYQSYFTLLFDNAWKNINGINPTEIGDINGLNFNTPGFTKNALKVEHQKSYLQYSCENVFNPGFGTVSAWVKFDNFNKDAVIWQTNDSRYALYFETGGDNFDKRIVARAGGNEDGEYPQAKFILDPKGSAVNKWNLNEWHFLTMTWEGKFSGVVKLYVDGRRVDQAEYKDATGCSTFRVGNSYRNHDNMNFSIGAIDELKVHEWAMSSYYVNRNYSDYAYSSNFGKTGTPEPRIAGVSIRSFKDGQIVKAPDNKVYIIANQKSYHVSDMSALNRLRPSRLVNITWDELENYPNVGKFYAWTKYLRGTLLKAQNSNTIYWSDGHELHPILNESVFNRYGNQWKDVITISQAELDGYPIGSISR